MDSIICVIKKIEEIIKISPVPEDPIHSKNTLEWVLKLKPDADNALKIAALGHDIERAIEERKVRHKDYNSFDEFKDAHATNSAMILAEIMEQCGVSKRFIKDSIFLVSRHETGGTKRADILKDADSISFFHVNLPYYYIRNGKEETKKRCLWGYRRLSDNLKGIIFGFEYENREIALMLKACIDEKK